MPAAGDGAYFVDSLCLTRFADQDTSTTRDRICFDIHFDSAAGYNFLESIGMGTLWIVFNENPAPGGANFFYKNYKIADFVTGWNHFEITKSEWLKTGDPGWCNIGCVYLALLSEPEGFGQLTADNIRMRSSAFL